MLQTHLLSLKLSGDAFESLNKIAKEMNFKNFENCLKQHSLQINTDYKLDPENNLPNLDKSWIGLR
jgi:hypothetical protein